MATNRVAVAQELVALSKELIAFDPQQELDKGVDELGKRVRKWMDKHDLDIESDGRYFVLTTTFKDESNWESEHFGSIRLIYDWMKKNMAGIESDLDRHTERFGTWLTW